MVEAASSSELWAAECYVGVVELVEGVTLPAKTCGFLIEMFRCVFRRLARDCGEPLLVDKKRKLDVSM